MVTAEVYCKWSSQGDGNRGGGAWALMGLGTANMGGGGGATNALSNHAERLAWAAAWGRNTVNNLRVRVNDTRANFRGDNFQVKFWVDAQICPTCQKWLLVDVISHMKQLSALFGGMRVDLFAEVRASGATTRVDVKRSTVWPVSVAQIANYSELPKTYN
jgi:hypothetical protein